VQADIDALRVFLFLGLVFHKALWEVLKRKSRVRSFAEHTSRFLAARLSKLIKIALLIFLLFQTLFLDLFPIAERPNLLRVIGVMIYSLGLGMAVLGRVHLGANWMDLEDYQASLNQSLITDGIYRYVRHPIYGGDILLLLGLELALNSWLVLGVAIILLFVIRQIILEESLLSQKFSGYHDYCLQTKRFIPFLV
jgi:protein-S-isoprenylcysteine O-methyltransferase Ste14